MTFYDKLLDDREGLRSLAKKKSRKKGSRVFILDDDIDDIMIAQDIIHGGGYRTKAADKPAEFLGQYHRNDIGLLLCDIRMPQMDGIGVISALSEGGLPIIAWSAVYPSPSEADFLQINGVPFFLKGDHKNILLGMVDSMMGI